MDFIRIIGFNIYRIDNLLYINFKNTVDLICYKVKQNLLIQKDCSAIYILSKQLVRSVNFVIGRFYGCECQKFSKKIWADFR